MKFEWYTEPETHDLVFSGRVTARDLASIRFDHVERVMMRMSHTTAADMLLTLEMLFRRMQEHTEAVRPIAALLEQADRS